MSADLTLRAQMRLASPRSRMLPVLAAAIALLVALSALAAAPSPTLAATTLAARCDVNLRVKPRTSSRVVRTLPAGATVTAVAKVGGTRWKAKCQGTAYAGSGWWKITSVNGRSVQSRYGVKAVYAARKLFKSVVTPVAREAACSGVALRTSASTGGTLKTRLDEGVDVTTVATVSGGSWAASCSGSTSGATWYRITEVDGRSVAALYGVTYLYGAKGLFRAPTTAPEPTPTPAPTPIPAPTPTPAPSPSPSPPSAYAEGIDISHWQGTIDWAQVAGAGKRFAYMKASEGTSFVDPTYPTNRAQAKANGLYVGAYHFAGPGPVPGDAEAEADHFVDTAQPQSGELIPGPGPGGDRRPGHPDPQDLGQDVPAAGLRPDGDPRGDLRVTQLLVEQDGQHRLVRRQRLPGPVGRPLDHGDRTHAPGEQLGWLRLVVLAVHVERCRARDQRGSRPRPLSEPGLLPGPHPVASNARAGAAPSRPGAHPATP